MVSEEVDLYFDDLKSEMEKAVSYMKSEFAGYRAGRANPHILDKVLVNYYGTPTPVSQMANIAVTEARVLTISVWDASALKDVSKAIMASDIGINPNDDGRVIRLVFPMLTEERRRDLVKQIKQMGENTKITLRNIRRDCLDNCKKLNKDKLISDDQLELIEKEVQKQLDMVIANVDKAVMEKEKEVMSV